MKRSRLIILTIPMTILMLSFSSCRNEKKMEIESQTTSIDLAQARKTIEDIGRQFSEDYKNGDSMALAAHYAKDGTFGSIKGEDLVSAFGKNIRNGRKNGTPYLLFTTNSVFSDGEYLIELGIFESKDTDNNVKSSGKYLVVWKQEDGEWKMYRDIGL